jgi:flagellar motor protein MotB
MSYGTFGSKDTERSNYVAERKNEQQPQVQQQDDQFQRVSRATAEAQQEAERLQLDETEPGGRYIVGGIAVNSEGAPLDEKKD